MLALIVGCLLSVGFKAVDKRDISLDGEWLFVADSADHSAGLPEDAKVVTVPHTYNVMPGLEDYSGRAWYGRRIHIPAEMKDRRLRIRFEAVYHDAKVYVNGRKAGSHIGKGYTPFSFEITPYVEFGKDNIVTVEVDNSFSDYNFPYGRAFDWANDGGIYRHVSLHSSGSKSIRYAHFTPVLSEHDSTGKVHVSIRLYEQQVKKASFALTIRSRETGGMAAGSNLTLKQSGNGTFEADIDCGKVTPWHFNHPALYDFEVSVMDGKTVSDTYSGHIGFRSFRIDGNRFVLNGEPVRLPGIESMPGSNPDYGMAEPTDYIRATAEMLKDLNTTITRFHWVQGNDMLDAFDSLGILVQEELSWWAQPRNTLTPELQQLAREALEEMIEAHYNHPCIFAWVISNEVSGNGETVKTLGEFIRQLDRSRMAETVSNQTYTSLADDSSMLLDIPTWNEYIGTWSGSGKKKREELPGYLEKIGRALAGRPLLITEYGLCEPAFTGGDRRRVDDMLYHVREWNRQDFITGYIYFCLEDYRTQMGEEGVGKYRIRRHGVTDCRHRPKPSYHVLRDLMCPVEIDLVRGSSDQMLTVGIRVKDGIPSYTLRGYTLRYEDAGGTSRTIALPVMEPGSRCEIPVPSVNARFKFDICRPDGGACLNY